jgi:hypothetical protein
MQTKTLILTDEELRILLRALSSIELLPKLDPEDALKKQNDLAQKIKWVMNDKTDNGYEK